MSSSSSDQERKAILKAINLYRKRMMMNFMFFFSSTLLFIYTIFDNFRKPYAFYLYFGLMFALISISILLSKSLKNIILKEHDFIGFNSSLRISSMMRSILNNWLFILPAPIYLILIKLDIVNTSEMGVWGIYILRFILLYIVVIFIMNILNIFSSRIYYAFFAPVIFFDSKAMKIFDHQNSLIGAIEEDFRITSIIQEDVNADFSKWKFEQAPPRRNSPAQVKCLSVKLFNLNTKASLALILPHTSKQHFSQSYFRSVE